MTTDTGTETALEVADAAPLAKATREAILALTDTHDFEVEDVPEWGMCIGIKPLSGAGRDAFEMACVQRPDEASATLLAYTACDPETGRLLFRPGDIKALKMRSAKVLSRLRDLIWERSDLDGKAAERAVKNSESDQSDSSGS